jgi:hypothetical protein
VAANTYEAETRPTALIGIEILTVDAELGVGGGPDKKYFDTIFS